MSEQVYRFDEEGLLKIARELLIEAEHMPRLGEVVKGALADAQVDKKEAWRLGFITGVTIALGAIEDRSLTILSP